MPSHSHKRNAGVKVVLTAIGAASAITVKIVMNAVDSHDHHGKTAYDDANSNHTDNDEETMMVVVLLLMMTIIIAMTIVG